MSSASAGRVSRDGRRKGTSPPGSAIKRKNAASISVRASMLRIQGGSAPRTVNSAPATKKANVAAAWTGRGFREALRNDFNCHPLRAEVMGNVFAGHREALRAGNGLLGNQQ